MLIAWAASFRFVSFHFDLIFVFVFRFRFWFSFSFFVFVFCFRVCVLFSCSLAGWCGLDTHAVMQRLRNMPAPFTRWVLLLLFYLIPVLPHSSSDRQRPAAGRDSEPKKPAGLDASTCPPGNPEGMSALCTLHSYRRERALSVCRSRAPSADMHFVLRYTLFALLCSARPLFCCCTLSGLDTGRRTRWSRPPTARASCSRRRWRVWRRTRRSCGRKLRRSRWGWWRCRPPSLATSLPNIDEMRQIITSMWHDK